MFATLKQKIQENQKIIIAALAVFFLLNLSSHFSSQSKKSTELIDTQEHYLAEIVDKLKELNDKLEETNDKLTKMEDYLWSIEFDVSTKLH